MDELKYRCPYCPDQIFDRRNWLSNHVRTKHADQYPAWKNNKGWERCSVTAEAAATDPLVTGEKITVNAETSTVVENWSAEDYYRGKDANKVIADINVGFLQAFGYPIGVATKTFRDALSATVKNHIPKLRRSAVRRVFEGEATNGQVACHVPGGSRTTAMQRVLMLMDVMETMFYHSGANNVAEPSAAQANRGGVERDLGVPTEDSAGGIDPVRGLGGDDDPRNRPGAGEAYRLGRDENDGTGSPGGEPGEHGHVDVEGDEQLVTSAPEAGGSD